MNERADRLQDPAEMTRALSFAESIVETVRDPLLVLDADLRVLRANRSFLHTFQVSRDETEGHPIFDFGDGQWDIPELRRLLEVILPQHSHFDDFHMEHEFPRIGRRVMRLNARCVRDDAKRSESIVLAIEDVTEQRRSEQTIRDAKQYAENIVDTVRHPLLVLDADHRVQTANRSFYRDFLVTPEQTQGQLIYDLGNGQWNIPRLRELLTEILPQNTSFDDYDVEHAFPSIGHRFMQLNARRMYREGNHTELILVAIEDVTEQRRAEQQRRELETRFTYLVKNIKDHSIFTLNPKGYITSWNQEAEKILGYSEHEALGRHFSIIFTAEDVEQGVPQHELEAAADVGRAEDERWHRRKNGELFWALGIVTPTTDAEGNHTGYSKILRDITERKLAQEALFRQSEQLRTLWDSAAVLMTAPNPETMMQETFRRVREHLNVDAYFNFVVDEAGESLRLVSYSGIPQAAAESIQRLRFGEAICGTVALEKRSIVAEYIQQSDDPGIAVLRRHGFRAYACYPLIVEDHLIGTLSFASHRNDAFQEDELAFFTTLSQYVTMAYARLRLVEELQAADRRKDEFLAMLAHELRNPLAPIRSGLDILAMELSEHRDIIELLQAQVTHLVRLVDDLLDVSRILRGKVELRREQVELASIIQQAVQASRATITAQQQKLSVSVPEEGVLLDADPVRLVQVVANLLNNAAKYSDAGRKIELAAECVDGAVSITVRDCGIGIAPDLLPVVFDLFTQSTGSLDRSQGGLGIGLTIVKNLVELHGGGVSVHSEGLGKGSTFVVRLPAVVGVKRPELERKPTPVAVRRRILAVDDNVGAAHLLSVLLTKLGDHEVQIAHDGPAALAKMQEFRPEIVLLDIGLPGKDGHEVAKEIRANKQFDDVLLVALTGYGQQEDREKSKAVGFDEHLVKPPSLDQLQEILAHPKLTR